MNESFLLSLARPQPIPGGGAAAAYTASVGLALLEKITRLEMQRDELQNELSPIWKTLLGKVIQLAEACSRLRDEDGAAYLTWTKTKVSEENVDEIHDALEQATACPIDIAEQVREAMECAIEAGKYAKKHLLSDLLVVCEVLNGAGKGAAHIAFANLGLMADTSTKKDFERQLARLQTLVDESYNGAREGLFHRLYPSQ